MREIPVTVVALMADTIRVYVVPGHHTKVKAVDLLVKSDGIDPDAQYQAWTTVFDPSMAQQVAQTLMENARKLRLLIFKY